MTSEFAPIDFMKLHGSGNDFVVIDNRGGGVPESCLGEFSELVSRRARSVGADGVVLIEAPVEPDTDFHWRYFNADGSEGEMCGNGAMCGARFAELIGAAPANTAFSTKSGVVRARVDAASGEVELAMPDTGPIEAVRTVEVEGTTYELVPIQVGCRMRCFSSMMPTHSAAVPSWSGSGALSGGRRHSARRAPM